jgi:hypothetical protein
VFGLKTLDDDPQWLHRSIFSLNFLSSEIFNAFISNGTMFLRELPHITATYAVLCFDSSYGSQNDFVGCLALPSFVDIVKMH